MTHPKILFLFICLFFSITCNGKPGSTVYDVTKFGAVGDGKTLNTNAIQKAIDACSSQGGGVVLISEGIFVSGTIFLKSDVNLTISDKATLLGSTNISDYRMLDGFKDGRGSSMGYCFIGGADVKNSAISGKGTIDGNGKVLLEKNGRGKRPFLVRFVRCTGMGVTGVTMKGPAAWTVHFFECKNITAEKVIIRSGGLGNNDGFDIDSCDGVVIKDCDIDSGDDAICLKTTGPLPCRNIEVFNCRINTSQGAFKLGTESFGNFENIHIHNCKVENTRGIKLYSVDGSYLKNLRISDITIEKTTLPILLRLGSRLKTFREGDIKKPVGKIEGVVLKNISVRSATQMAILISGIPGHKIKDVSITGITVRLPGGGTQEDAGVSLAENEVDYPEVTMFGKQMPAYGMYVRHAEQITVKNVKILLDRADSRPAIVGIDLADIRIEKWKSPVTASAEPFIKLETVDKVVLAGIKSPQKPAIFLQVEGESNEIVIHGDESKIILGKDVSAKTVTFK